ncbi:MAG: DnaJ domain-containing protein [Lachnospiraceae bacterium]|nr:DnaJ domain-containing protein [Lachnospiraceae bacterium]
MDGREAYAWLGLQDKFVSKDQIKRAYREKCKQLHPDDNPNPEALTRYLKVQEAYRWIMEHGYFSNQQVSTYTFPKVERGAPRRTGKIIGNWEVSEPKYSQLQYRQKMSKKLEEEQKKRRKEEAERQWKLFEERRKARKLPSEREAEKWKKIKDQQEAERIARIIQKLMGLDLQ